MYGVINTDDTTTNELYIIKFLSETYTLQNNTTIYGKVLSTGELVVKAKYLLSMQENTNWYWKQQPLKHTIIVPTRTILHPRLDVIIISYIQDTHKDVCGINQEKNSYKDIQLV